MERNPSKQARTVRQSKNRIRLLELFSKSPSPLSVPEILDAFGKEKPNKTTVYRELEFLKSQKIVREIDLGDLKKRYERYPADHHHHIVCTDCKTVACVTIDRDVEALEQRITQKNKFKITSHTLEFFGVCETCQPQ